MKRCLLVVTLVGACTTTSGDSVTVTQDIGETGFTLIELTRPHGQSIDPTVSMTLNGVDEGSGQVGGASECPASSPDCSSPFASWLVDSTTFDALTFPATIEIDDAGDRYSVTVADVGALPVTQQF